MWRIVFTLIKRDLAVYRRRPLECLLPGLFFIIILSLFSFSVELSAQALSSLFPNLIWVGISLSTLLSIESLFRTDFEEGGLEQLLVMGLPLSIIVFGKLLAHWLASFFVWMLLSPIFALILGLDFTQYSIFLILLLLGTFSLNGVMAIGAALTLSLKRGGVLLGVLTLPLVLPVILVGGSALFALSNGLHLSAHLSLLLALCVMIATLAPLSVAAALKVSVQA